MGDSTLSTQSLLFTLPAELRERIYSLHFLDILALRNPSVPIEPPLTRVSKRIRNETLLLYYTHYRLSIQTYIRCSYHGQVWLRTPKQTHHTLAPTKLSQICHFVFHFALIDRYTGERVPIEFYVDLNKRLETFELRQAFARSWFRNPHRIGDPADFEELIEVLRCHLVGVLEVLVVKPGIGEWTQKELDWLVKVDPDSLPLHTMS